MANRNFRADLRSPDQGLVFVPGTIRITGSNGATTQDTLTYASASNLGTGIYRVTFEDSFVSLRSAQLTLASTGSAGLTAVLSGTNAYSPSGKTLDFLIVNSSGALTKPQVANTDVQCLFIFKNSVV